MSEEKTPETESQPQKKRGFWAFQSYGSLFSIGLPEPPRPPEPTSKQLREAERKNLEKRGFVLSDD